MRRFGALWDASRSFSSSHAFQSVCKSMCCLHPLLAQVEVARPSSSGAFLCAHVFVRMHSLDLTCVWESA
eukprot:6177050-Pleurochrysis_carterae.AAC.2